MINGDGVDGASFRDPSGRVLLHEGRILRAISPSAAPGFRAVLESGLLERWANRGDCVSTRLIEPTDVPSAALACLPFEPALLLEHEALPFVSYPYEWPFSLLKRAALLHLSLQLEALDAGFSFSDASAYNVQFRGVVPVFIDVLSLRPYREGEYWQGYRQFCEQFLNPLLLTALRGVPYHAWYRGALSGISVSEIAALVPLLSRLRPSLFAHVTMHARLIATASASSDGKSSKPAAKLSPAGYRGIVSSLRTWIDGLEQKGTDTFWRDYEANNSYVAQTASAKHQFVADYAARVRPTLLVDVGCNAGDYTEAALTAGARRAVGFDFDHGALARAVRRASKAKLDFLPLFSDAANPTPSQGWLGRERSGFAERVASADGLLALALIHHLTIGANIPLSQAVGWLVRLAPTGIIEFVPRGDPMVDGMLARREDIFADYSLDAFKRHVSARAAIVREQELTPGGRVLVEYRVGDER